MKTLLLTLAVPLLAASPGTVPVSAGELPHAATPVVPFQASAFSPADVRLLDGPLLRSREVEAKYLLSLDLDRLLAPYRAGAGLTPKAPLYPGWETRALPGVGLAFYLSGMAQLSAATGDPEYARRLHYILDELDTCQQAADGYLLGMRDGRSVFARVEKEGKFEGFSDWYQGTGTPYYCLEKLFSGLRDAWRITGLTKALQIEVRLGDWLERHMARVSDAHLADLMTIEWGGMNWVLADLYADTGDTRYLAMSRRWHDALVMDGPAAGRDDLAGKHANTQFPKFSGLAARYPYSGDPADRKTAEFFWQTVVRHHSYVTGANSQAEHFTTPDSLNGTLTNTTAENCNVYNMLRLTQLLFNISPRAEYAEYMERALFNHILPAQDTTDGRVCYYLPLKSGASRAPEGLYDRFTCCVCSGFDSYARNATYIYSHSADTLYVNLFAASEVTWAAKGLTLRQETKFPDEDSAAFHLKLRQPARFTLRLRYPAWTAAGVKVSVNGAAQPITAAPGEYLSLEREWRDGDSVAFQAPFVLRSEAMADNPNRMALFVGPILLAGDLGPTVNPASEDPGFVPLLVPGDKPLRDWLQPTGAPLTFKTAVARPHEVVLQPFYRLPDRSYGVYWDKVDEAGWTAHLDSVKRMHEAARQLDARTIDRLDFSDAAAVQAHQVDGGNSGQGDRGLLMHRAWRQARANQSFSVRMKIPPEKTATLLCRYSPAYVSNVEAGIFIDDTQLAPQASSRESRLCPDMLEVEYPIPDRLLLGKSEVQIAFRSGSSPTQRIYELRIIKPRE
jgi:DUF1680 family protein